MRSALWLPRIIRFPRYKFYPPSLHAVLRRSGPVKKWKMHQRALISISPFSIFEQPLHFSRIKSCQSISFPNCPYISGGGYISQLCLYPRGEVWSRLGRWLVLWPALILNGEKCAPPEKWGVAQFPFPMPTHFCQISFLLKLSISQWKFPMDFFADVQGCTCDRWVFMILLTPLKILWMCPSFCPVFMLHESCIVKFHSHV